MIEDKHLSAPILESEHGSARSTASAEDQYLGAANLHSLLKRTYDSRNIGVETVQFAVEQAKCVDGADFRRERVRLLEVRNDVLLQRHRDGDALDRNLMYKLQ